MELNKTYYDGLKAKVEVRRARYAGNHTAYVWALHDSGGELMAAGTEYTLKNAFESARMAVTGVRLWSVFARGALIPSNDGRRWFTYVNTEHGATNFEVPARQSENNLAKLTETIRKGKVKV